MVDYMRAKNIISSDPVIQAFRAIDRAYFLKGGEGANTYLNSELPYSAPDTLPSLADVRATHTTRLMLRDQSQSVTASCTCRPRGSTDSQSRRSPSTTACRF